MKIMKIGLFSDSYYPSTNGIAVVIDILHDNLVKLGHEVVIIAPRPGLRSKHGPTLEGKNIIWIPAIEGLFFDEYLTSVFSPTAVVRKIERQELDVVIIFTPAQVGLLGAYIAKRNKIPLIEQYSTDLSGYISRYPSTIIGMFALSLSAPFALKMKLKDIASLTKTMLSVKRTSDLKWSQDVVSRALAIMHNNTDLVIALSDKLAMQMKKDGVKTAIKVLPTGVDKIPGSKNEATNFRRKNGVKPEEKLILYAGRLGAEKNLDLLIESFFEVASQNEHVKLMFVGDFSYKPVLEKMARSSGFNNRIIFAGRMPRASLGSVYMAADIFAFPSLTDTQALVLNEAAHAGLPIVWCDKYLNKVAVHGKNGICAEPNVASFTKALNELITNDEKRRKFGLRSKVEAKKFGEAKMTKKLIRELEAL